MDAKLKAYLKNRKKVEKLREDLRKHAYVLNESKNDILAEMKKKNLKKLTCGKATFHLSKRKRKQPLTKKEIIEKMKELSGGEDALNDLKDNQVVNEAEEMKLHVPKTRS